MSHLFQLNFLFEIKIVYITIKCEMSDFFQLIFLFEIKDDFFFIAFEQVILHWVGPVRVCPVVFIWLVFHLCNLLCALDDRTTIM